MLIDEIAQSLCEFCFEVAGSCGVAKRFGNTKPCAICYTRANKILAALAKVTDEELAEKVSPVWTPLLEKLYWQGRRNADVPITSISVWGEIRELLTEALPILAARQQEAVELAYQRGLKEGKGE